MAENKQDKGGMLRAIFQRAIAPVFNRIDHVITHYPSKAAGATGLCGDMMFLTQTVMTGNHAGIAAAMLGAYGSIHIIRYGDPKIPKDQVDSYVDPQGTRKKEKFSWITQPTIYPWEHLGVARSGSMALMMTGGMVGSSYGEIGYAGFALAGYAIKMFVAQEPAGSVEVPAKSHGVTKLAYQAKAFVQEKPNTAVGILWNAALVPYVAEAILEQDHLKFSSAVLWFLPTVLTMVSSKRAQVLPEPPSPNNP